jgi:Asp-tRNA(Asn)/Glu-tRNA(Gln) amidotransferase A subunit family amidase
MEELPYLSACEALDLFGSRGLSPVELLDAVLGQANELEPQVHAFTELMLEEAYTAARLSESRYARGGSPRPLEGLPLALKEEQPIAGRRLEEGSLLARGEIAHATHPVVSRVLDAGAVVHARTTTPEFSCAPFTHSELWGITRNPWNTEFSPGGSSGGSAASLAAGTTTLATGSDIGGSIRLPASFCGVVGFKPPFGRVSGMPPFNQDTYCADGPMGRTVADVALLQNVIAGPHPNDQASLRPAHRLPVTFDAAVRDLAGFRVGLCVALGDYVVDPEVEANTRAAADLLRGASATVVEVSLPWTVERITRAAMIHFGGIFGAVLGEVGEEQFGLLMPYTQSFVRRTAEAMRSSSLVAGLALETELYVPLGALLDDVDVLLCPTFAGQGLVAGDDYVAASVPVGDQLIPWEHAMMTLPFNVVGRCPVLSVPSGRASNGVPTGVQIVGRSYDDTTVFRVGAGLEALRPWWGDPLWRPGA